MACHENLLLWVLLCTGHFVLCLYTPSSWFASPLGYCPNCLYRKLTSRSFATMQLPPVEVWTAWPHPNYVNPETGGTYNTIITLILLPISIVIIGLRSFTRLRISKNFGLDDGLIVAALVCSSMQRLYHPH